MKKIVVFALLLSLFTFAFTACAASDMDIAEDCAIEDAEELLMEYFERYGANIEPDDIEVTKSRQIGDTFYIYLEMEYEYKNKSYVATAKYEITVTDGEAEIIDRDLDIG